jgi:hypothetical protein
MKKKQENTLNSAVINSSVIKGAIVKRVWVQE